MGALAVLLPCYLSSLIGYAGAGRRGRDPTSQKGPGGAPEGERLPSNGAVARRVPGLARGGSREAAAHPGLWRGATRAPKLPGVPRRQLWACPQENCSLSCGGLEQASTLVSDRWRGRRLTARLLCRAPAAIVSVRGMEDSGNPPLPPPLPGPLGNSKKSQRRFWEFPAFSPRKARGWPFQTQTADPRQCSPPSASHRNL